MGPNHGRTTEVMGPTGLISFFPALNKLRVQVELYSDKHVHVMLIFIQSRTVVGLLSI